MDYMSKDEADAPNGFVYLVEAQGFHGVLSPWKKRLKIGLSNNPARRLKELNSEQAPCPIIGIRCIEVPNCAATEKNFHEKFSSNRKHGEWFDFWIWELNAVNRAYDSEVRGKVKIPIASIVLAGLGVAAIAFSVTFSLSVSNSSPVRYQTEIDLDGKGVKQLK